MKYELHLKQDIAETQDVTEAVSKQSAAKIFYARMSDSWKAEWSLEDLEQYITAVDGSDNDYVTDLEEEIGLELEKENAGLVE